MAACSRVFTAVRLCALCWIGMEMRCTWLHSVMVNLPYGSAIHTCLMSWVDGNRSRLSRCRPNNSVDLCTRALLRWHHFHLKVPNAGGRTHLMSYCLLLLKCRMRQGVADEDSEHFQSQMCTSRSSLMCTLMCTLTVKPHEHACFTACMFHGLTSIPSREGCNGACSVQVGLEFVAWCHRQTACHVI